MPIPSVSDALLQKAKGTLPAIIYAHLISSAIKGNDAHSINSLSELLCESPQAIKVGLDQLDTLGLITGFNSDSFVIKQLVVNLEKPKQGDLFQKPEAIVSREKRLMDEQLAKGGVVLRGEVQEHKHGDAFLYATLRVYARSEGASDNTFKVEPDEQFGTVRLAFEWFDEYVKAYEAEQTEPGVIAGDAEAPSKKSRKKKAEVATDTTPESQPDSEPIPVVVPAEPVQAQSFLHQVRDLKQRGYGVPTPENGTAISLSPASYEAYVQEVGSSTDELGGVYVILDEDGHVLEGLPI